MKIYLRLLKFVRPHIWILALAVLCMLAASVFDGVSIGIVIPFVDQILGGQPISIPPETNVPLFIQDLVNKINSLDRIELLNWLTLGIVIVFFMKELFIFGHSYLMNNVSQRVIRDIKNALYGKILSLSLSFYDRSSSGKLVSRITYDTGVIQNSISEGLADLILHSFKVFIYLAVVLSIRKWFNISWSIILLSLLLLPTVIYPIIRIGQRLRKISRHSQEKMGQINTTLFETISGIGIVKAFCLESDRWERFREQNQQFFKIMMKSIKREIAVGPLTEFVVITCGVIVLWLAGRQMVSGRLDSGALVAFLGALMALGKPFKRLGRVHTINQKALAAGARIFEILDMPPEIKEKAGATVLTGVKRDIAFKDVWFKYNDRMILEGINLKVNKGEIIAIVGPSGVGKTTLVNLIPRFYDATRGAVEIDGQDIREFTLESLRSKIGLVTQETILFDDTITANIGFGRLGARQEEIEEASRIANCHEFIQRMPLKYDTFIGERGFRLSGGQRQRLAIARAILKNPPILILDEATSQLDAESETLVREAIEKLMVNRTVFVIAHRLSTIQHASRIVVLHKGRIENIGTHQELMESDKLYQRLYQNQFKN